MVSAKLLSSQYFHPLTQLHRSQVSELEKDGSLALVSFVLFSFLSSPLLNLLSLINFQPEFTHLYLPELIQAHSLASASEFDNFWTRTLVLVAVVGNAYFDRYARKPVEGSNLLECLLKSLAENFPSHPELLDPVRLSALSSLSRSTLTIVPS